MATNPQRIPPNSSILQKPQENYPTPDVRNKLLVEYVPMEVGKYQLLDYGTEYSTQAKAPFSTTDYKGYILVSQSPAFDNNSWFIRRVWAAPWVGQDDWNYSYKYLDGDPDYPVITRIDTVLRETYEPLPALTPDPDHPGAYLTEEQMLNQTDPPEMHSKFVQVVRTYTTLPGPISTSQDFDFQLNTTVFTDRQLVFSDDLFLPEYEPLLLAMQETPASKYYKLRVKSYLQELPPSKVELSTGRYPFPTLLYDIVYSQATIAPSPNPFSDTTPPAALTRQEVIIIPDTRAAPNAPALFSTETTFSVGPPVLTPADDIYLLLTKNCVAQLIAAQIQIPNVLCDEITVALDFNNDGRYGDLDASVTFGATVPSATEYANNVIGTYRVVRVDTQRWRGQIYVKQVASVKMV